MIYPANYNLPPILKGATYDFTMIYKVDGVAVDLTTYEAQIQSRQTIDATTTILDISSSDSITLGIEGTFEIHLTADQTASYQAGNYIYDLKLTHPDNTKSRIISGVWPIIEGVTR